MRKIYWAKQTGGNKWERKTKWQMETEDFICFFVLVVIAGYVVVRAIIG